MSACCAGLGASDGAGRSTNFDQIAPSPGFANKSLFGAAFMELLKMVGRRFFKPLSVGLNEMVFVWLFLPPKKFLEGIERSGKYESFVLAFFVCCLSL